MIDYEQTSQNRGGLTGLAGLAGSVVTLDMRASTHTVIGMATELTTQQLAALRRSSVRPSSYVTVDETLRIFQSVEVNISFRGEDDKDSGYSEFLWVLGNGGWGQYDWHLVRIYEDGRGPEVLQRSQDGWGSSAHALKAGLNAVLD